MNPSMKKRISDHMCRGLWRMAVLLFLFGAVLTSSETSAASDGSAASADASLEESVSPYTGWKTVKGEKYYYVKDSLTKGWKKISGKYYYFNNKGQLQTNKIAGTKKSGYYYVDKSGVRVTTTEMKLAVSFVLKNSHSSKTRSQRLLECYTALRSYPYKRYYGDEPSAGTLAGYAKDMLQNKTGNCYRYACAMAYIAKALGYDVRVAVGGVTAYSGSLSPHGWCEVKIGSSWKILDVSMHNGHPSAKMYLVKRSEYPYRLRCDKVYTMKISKGKLTWK